MYMLIKVQKNLVSFKNNHIQEYFIKVVYLSQSILYMIYLIYDLIYNSKFLILDQILISGFDILI